MTRPTTAAFIVMDDTAFKAIVLVWLIEPTSKAQAIRVFQQIDAPHRHCGP
ncbi:hypothetical protein [Glutamicibacter sp. MCAF14]|uniref:hypothetical protein n=1 Tax=Glutamicibacter sp. MCAF14 TaxID=3233043 RepID=UPI003F8F4A79